MWKNKSWILHQDNDPAHTALSSWQCLAKNNIPPIALLEPPPPYPPDLACDFLFPKLKEIIKGTNFGDVEAIKRAVTLKLNVIPEESLHP